MSELMEQINQNQIPKHIGIILDGNGRWAKKRLMPRMVGHHEGMKRVVEIVEFCAKDLKLASLSLYAFSTENWKRPEEEVSSLMQILVNYIQNQLDRLIQNNVRLNIMGDILRLPDFARKEVEKALLKTKDNTGMILNIGLNYGGRIEIIQAVKKILKDYDEDPTIQERLDEKQFSNYLYTAGQEELDLLIRPGGERRISNFMIYQLAYTELYFCDTFWPDFDKQVLIKAIQSYQERDRRYGGLK